MFQSTDLQKPGIHKNITRIYLVKKIHKNAAVASENLCRRTGKSYWMDTDLQQRKCPV